MGRHRSGNWNMLVVDNVPEASMQSVCVWPAAHPSNGWGLRIGPPQRVQQPQHHGEQRQSARLVRSAQRHRHIRQQRGDAQRHLRTQILLRASCHLSQKPDA